jgi:hypothetical protein
MPLVFERDDERRRITVTLTGPVLLAELNANLERLGADGVWDYAVLYDGRMATTARASSRLSFTCAALGDVWPSCDHLGPAVLLRSRLAALEPPRTSRAARPLDAQ